MTGQTGSINSVFSTRMNKGCFNFINPTNAGQAAETYSGRYFSSTEKPILSNTTSSQIFSSNGYTPTIYFGYFTSTAAITCTKSATAGTDYWTPIGQVTWYGSVNPTFLDGIYVYTIRQVATNTLSTAARHCLILGPSVSISSGTSTHLSNIRKARFDAGSTSDKWLIANRQVYNSGFTSFWTSLNNPWIYLSNAGTANVNFAASKTLEITLVSLG